MSKAKALVGFDRYVEKQWMDKTAALVAEGKTLAEINSILDDYLLPSIAGETSRRKTKNILTATWVKSFKAEVAFKAEAVALFEAANNAEQLAIHYGMSIATYPYFLSLSKILGRLFKLQDEVTNAEFNRRVIESVGDRESIKRAAARYLQSLIQWGLIEANSNGGVKPGIKIPLHNSAVVTWLYSSTLFSVDKNWLSIDDINADPAWFPFDIAHGYFNVQSSNLIEVVHQGVGNTLIAIKAVGK